MIDFMLAALPWIVCGLVLAIFFARYDKEKAESTYMSQGMAIGMCFGCAIDSSIGRFTGIGMLVGMLVGMFVGMNKNKE